MQDELSYATLDHRIFTARNGLNLHAFPLTYAKNSIASVHMLPIMNDLPLAQPLHHDERLALEAPTSYCL